jgi:hypothetical protein
MIAVIPVVFLDVLEALEPTNAKARDAVNYGRLL